MKKAMFLFLAVALFLCSCSTQTDGNIPEESKDPIFDGTVLSEPPLDSSLTENGRDRPDIPVTDPQRLSALWERYLLPAELNLYEFPDTSALTPYQTTRVAFYQFLSENDINTLARVENSEDFAGAETYLWPLDSAKTWVEALFDIRIDDPGRYFSLIEPNNAYGPEYSEAHGAVIFRKDEGKPWGVYESFRLDEKKPLGVCAGRGHGKTGRRPGREGEQPCRL